MPYLCLFERSRDFATFLQLPGAKKCHCSLLWSPFPANQYVSLCVLQHIFKNKSYHKGMDFSLFRLCAVENVFVSVKCKSLEISENKKKI